MADHLRAWRASVLGACCPALSVTAAAQELSRIGIDSVIAVDQFVGQNAADRPNIIVDVSAVVRLGGGWRAFVRPWFRQPRTAEWSKEIYQALLQYERPGSVSTRLDLGYLASPMGLGMMDSRPGVNPVIGGHAVYFSSLPAFAPGTPRVMPIASAYPLGGQLTLSTLRWDVRGAVVNTAPTRAFVINRAANPLSAPTVEGGIGFTPRTGMRLGASLAHGQYATQDELPPVVGAGRSMTLGGFEGELAVGYTKLAGEVMRTAFETGRGPAVAYSWFVQGTQTLAPRWFAAARQEGVSAPPAVSGVLAGRRSRLQASEATIGFRLSPDLTLRGSASFRKSFTRTDWDQQAGVSVVWARRWW